MPGTVEEIHWCVDFLGALPPEPTTVCWISTVTGGRPHNSRVYIYIYVNCLMLFAQMNINLSLMFPLPFSLSQSV